MTDISANGFSYDYQNDIRDLNDVFTQLQTNFPSLLQLVSIGRQASNTKIEWLEDTLSPFQTTISSFTTDGDGVGVVLASTKGLRVGSILRFTTSADVTRDEVVKVTAIANDTNITISREYGGTTAVTLAAGDKVFLISTPKEEGSEAVATGGQEPTVNHNFTQIFEDTAKVTRTQMQTTYYGLGVGKALEYQIKNKMTDLMWQLNNQLIFGRKVERSNSEKGSTGGILQFMESGNIDNTGGTISETILNNLIESIYSDGAIEGNLAIVCNSNQARKISKLNIASGHTIQVPQGGTSAGNYVQSFVSDLPIIGANVANIVVDQSFPKDRIAIVNPSKISLRFMQNWTDKDATPAGADYAARRILSEVAIQVVNGKQSHAIAKGLTV